MTHSFMGPMKRWNLAIFVNILEYFFFTCAYSLCSRLERLVLSHEHFDVAIAQYLSPMVSDCIRSMDITLPSTDPYKPPGKFCRLQQPEGLALNLFNYQLDAVSWMSSVESSATWIKYCPLLPWPFTRPDILFSESGCPYHISDPAVDNFIYKVKFRSLILKTKNSVHFLRHFSLA